jgi:hypothetical protein
MILALIKDEIVQNTIMADDLSVSSLFPDFLVIRIDELSQPPSIGWKYINGEFLPPIVE